MELIDLNARVAIAFSLTMIVALLTYIAFFKEPKTSKRTK